MSIYRNRIIVLATNVAKFAYEMNVSTSDYGSNSNLNTPGDPDRGPMGGDAGNSPAVGATPAKNLDSERAPWNRKRYPRFDGQMGLTSVDVGESGAGAEQSPDIGAAFHDGSEAVVNL